MHNKWTYFSVLGFLLALFNCTSSHKDFVKNEAIIPFLEEISIDTFYINEAYYPGVIYLFARNVNDTSFIQTLPSECVFEKSDLQHAFYWKGKLFLCKGDEDIFELLFDFSNNQIENSSIHSWKFCEGIGAPNDYDPKTISLVICGKEVEKVSLSDKKRDFIISGALPPPPPTDHQNSEILPIADM